MKCLFFVGSIFLLFSCEKEKPNYPEENNIESTEINQENIVKGDKGLPGYQLIISSDCSSCHKEDAKLVGPSYQDIAAKYTEADIDYLADKIVNGGSGVWGNVPMAEHAGMDKENAKKMVKYILSLKK